MKRKNNGIISKTLHQDKDVKVNLIVEVVTNEMDAYYIMHMYAFYKTSISTMYVIHQHG